MNTAQLAQRAAEAKMSDHLLPLVHWQQYSHDPAAIDATITGLSSLKRQLLESLVRLAGPLPFDLSKLESWHRIELPAAYIRTLLPELVQLGLIARLRKTWGELIYFIPSDIYEAVLRSYLEAQEVVNGDGVSADQLMPLSGLDAIEACEGAALAIFRFALRAAGEGIHVTAKGVLHKKELQRLIQEAELSDDPLSSLSFQHPYTDAMPKSVALILDMSLRLNMLSKAPSGYALVQETVGAWLKRPLASWRRAVYELTAEHYMANDVRMKHIVYALGYVGEDDRWHRVDDVIASLLNSKWLPNEQHLPESMYQQHAIQWLIAAHALGLCDVGVDNSDQCWYRWLAVRQGALSRIADNNEIEQVQPQQRGSFFIQPDFELLLLPESSYLVRWELESIAERASTAPMISYRLTRDSCQRAIEQQRNVLWQLQFMERHAIAGIPHNVQDALERWASQYGQTQFAEVVLLRAQDEQVAKLIEDELSSEAGVQLTSIGPKDFIIERSQADLLRKKLERLGVAPLKRWQSSEASEEDNSVPIYWEEATDKSPGIAAEGDQWMSWQQADDLGAKGMVYSPSALQYYEMDTLAIEEDVSVQFRQLPAMWTTSMRSYHASTLRELVSTAVQLQLPLQLDDEAGGQMTVLPLRIVAADLDSWHVSAEHRINDTTESKLITPHTWKGVRILLPDWLMS